MAKLPSLAVVTLLPPLKMTSGDEAEPYPVFPAAISCTEAPYTGRFPTSTLPFNAGPLRLLVIVTTWVALADGLAVDVTVSVTVPPVGMCVGGSYAIACPLEACTFAEYGQNVAGTSGVFVVTTSSGALRNCPHAAADASEQATVQSTP